MIDAQGLVGRLARANTSEGAAEILLDHVMGRCVDELVRVGLEDDAAILRSMIHFRADNGYRGLVALNFSQRSPRPIPDDLLPSTTASRWVERTGEAVAIDVICGEVSLLVGDGREPARLPAPELDTMTSEDSQQVLLHRGATHVLALPLRKPGGILGGMVTIEAECETASGQPFIWAAIRSDCQLLSDIAGPFVFDLPPRQARGLERDELMPVIGTNMALLLQTLGQFSQTSETILLQGQTGSGKSRLARWCHQQSPRRDRPFIAVDLTSVPEELQLAELFGWRKGAFTGAIDHHTGFVTQAEGGTLFLDEIDKLSLKAQAGLLSFIEDGRYHVLGSATSQHLSNLVLICATNADLKEEVANNRFREDLYYRINVLPIQIPPLDQRRDEIMPWAERFLIERHRERVPAGDAMLGADCAAVLLGRAWPGNLRQLNHVVRRAYALSLMDHHPGAETVTVSRAHLRTALAHEDDSGTTPQRLVEQMQILADQLIQASRDLAERGQVLDLAGPALRALMVHTANEQTGNLTSAYSLLGKQQVVRNRNHQKLFRQDLERLGELCALIGEDRPPIAR